MGDITQINLETEKLINKLTSIKSIDERAEKFAELFKGVDNTSFLADILVNLYNRFIENPDKNNQKVFFSFLSNSKGDLIIIKKAIELNEVSELIQRIKEKIINPVSFFPKKEQKFIDKLLNLIDLNDEDKKNLISIVTKKEQNKDKMPILNQILQKINASINKYFNKMILYKEGHPDYIKYQDKIKEVTEYLRNFEDYMNFGTPLNEAALNFFNEEEIYEVKEMINEEAINIDKETLNRYFDLSNVHSSLKKAFEDLKKYQELSEEGKNILLNWISLEEEAVKIKSDRITEIVDFTDSLAMSKRMAEAKAYDEIMREYNMVIQKIINNQSLVDNKPNFPRVYGEMDFNKILNKIKEKNENLYNITNLSFSNKIPTRELIAKTSIIQQIFENLSEIKRNKDLSKNLAESLMIVLTKFAKSEKISLSFPIDFFKTEESNKIKKIFHDIGLKIKKDETQWEIVVDGPRIWEFSTEEGTTVNLEELVEEEAKEETLKDIIFKFRNEWSALSSMLKDSKITSRETLQVFFINTINIKEIFMEMVTLRAWISKPRVAEEIAKSKLCPSKAFNQLLNTNMVPKIVLKNLLKTKAVTPEKQKMIQDYFKRIGYN